MTSAAMPAPLAAVLTLVFCSILRRLPGLVGYVYFARGARARRRARSPPCPRCGRSPSGCAAGCSRDFRGSRWVIRRSPASPLAGYVPVLGVYGVSLATVLTAGSLAVLGSRAATTTGRQPARALHRSSCILRPVLGVLWVGGFLPPADQLDEARRCASHGEHCCRETLRRT